MIHTYVPILYDIVPDSSDHTTLKTAIDACSLDGVLTSTSSLTVAPTDVPHFNLLQQVLL